MDMPAVHHGPLSDEILVLQGDHRFAYVWEGELVEQTLRTRRVDGVWDFMRERGFHSRVVQRLRDTGFYRIFEIGRLQLDWSLIIALIARWRPDTHTFHLPIGEATITLQDVQQFTGFRPQGEAAASGGSRISVTTIRKHLEAIGHHLFYQLGLQMQQHADNPTVTEYGRLVVELALRTLQRAREDDRLDYAAEYVAPEHYNQGRPVVRPRGRARARGSLQGCGGWKGGGP
ncbi:uncharacterized protein LOC142174455 [Nicotiana tabacum]|uniref:Uncharacterized protein LOC142174455 n=1 Tax=Nicotiana tabacum TaxID=4097 RepID=A0AC58TGJ7_TOBAC